MSTNLDIKFQEAFQKLSLSKETLTPDVMLKLYAFYKQATDGDTTKENSKSDIRNGFKFNAWMQLKGMSKERAKKEYIKLAKTIL